MNFYYDKIVDNSSMLLKNKLKMNKPINKQINKQTSKKAKRKQTNKHTQTIDNENNKIWINELTHEGMNTLTKKKWTSEWLKVDCLQDFAVSQSFLEKRKLCFMCKSRMIVIVQ